MLLFVHAVMIHPIEVAFESIDVSRPDPAEMLQPGRKPTPRTVQVSAGRAGAVGPPRIRRNRPRAALAGAWIRSAAAYEAGARSLPPTAATRLGGSISRGGSAPQ